MENFEQIKNCNANSSDQTAVPEMGLPKNRRAVRPWESGAEQTRDVFRQAKTVERVPRRWDRFMRLVGQEAVQKLLGSHVAVFGLGGVGSHAVEALARSAVGQLTLVDFDDVCVTNVNRQLQAFPNTVGQSKAALLAQRVRAINPDAWVEPIQAFYDAESSAHLLTPRPDFVIDAIDNVTAKIHLIETCLRMGIPAISVTGSGARLDPTQVRVADLSQTRHDPLARVLRKQLALRGIDTSRQVGLPVVFSEEEIRDPIAPSWDEEGFRCICPHAADSPHGCEKRRVIYGTASFVTAAFGMAAVSVAVKSLIDGDKSRA
jgi:tRNA A37 threonylcarbamoyladenosine dehydratase